jgi:type II secretory pathway pseudopilin PulG
VKRIRSDKGFTLLELAIAMAGMVLLTTAAIPYFIRQAEISAAQRTVNEVSTLQEAAKWYYLSNLTWPRSVQALQSAGLLSPQWSGKNPWGNGYSIVSKGTTLAVATTVPSSTAGVLLRALPVAALSGSGAERTVVSATIAPGYEASVDEVRNTALTALSTARESAVPAYGSKIEFGGRGWLPPCPPDHIVVGTWAGGGKNAAGIRCQKVARSGPLANDAITALQARIAQLNSDYTQLLVISRELQVRYQRLAQEYQAFREWLEDFRDDD